MRGCGPGRQVGLSQGHISSQSTAEGSFPGPWSHCWNRLPRITGNTFVFNLCTVLLAEVPGIYLQNILEGKCDHKARALGYVCFFSGS